MSFSYLLKDTCFTERFTSTTEDDYGAPVKVWTENLVDEPCRLVSGAGREVTVGAQVVIAEYRLFVGDIDITEQDRVTVNEILYEILLVISRADGTHGHHKECLLRCVR